MHKKEMESFENTHNASKERLYRWIANATHTQWLFCFHIEINFSNKYRDLPLGFPKIGINCTVQSV